MREVEEGDDKCNNNEGGKKTKERTSGNKEEEEEEEEASEVGEITSFISLISSSLLPLPFS